jgi:large subunit ribosomal protein L35
MPKMRSHSGSKKRFRVAKGGGVKIRKMNRNHILNKKSAKRKRDLRQSAYLSSAKQSATVRSMIQK